MEPVRIGFVGLNFGQRMIQRLRTGPGQAYFEVAAVCDAVASKAEALAENLGVQAYDSLERLLADPTIPAIGLYTAPVGRPELIRQIIRAGKDVMTTKPFADNPAEALKVLREARELGRVVHLNSPAPLLPPDLACIQRWQSEYDLGPIVACRGETWASYREQADGSWYDSPQLCPVAPIYRLGIYMINDLTRLLGPATHVQVMASRLLTGRPTPDNAQLGIRFQQGVLANIFASFCIQDGNPYCDSLILNFERGTIYRNVGSMRDPDSETSSTLSLVMGQPGQPFKVEQAHFATRSGEYQWENFYRAIHGEHWPEEVTPEQIVAGLQIIQAMSIAEQSGKTEVVSPVA